MAQVNRVPAVDAGAIPGVLDAIRQNSESVTVQDSGLNVLLNIALTESTRDSIMSGNVVPSVVAALKRFGAESTRVSLYGFALLSSLARGDSRNREIIVDQGAVKISTMALRNHYGSEEIQVNGIGLLANLAVNKHRESKLFEGVVGTVVTSAPGEETIPNQGSRDLIM